MPSKVWDEITYPFPNFNGAIIHAGLKLNRVSKRGSRYLVSIRICIVVAFIIKNDK